MSTVTEITSEEAYHSTVNAIPSTSLLVIFFHTPWAAPCTQMRSFFETLASTYPASSPPKITFLSLNAEDLPEVSESFDVTAVPFTVLQRQGKVIKSISGSNGITVREAVEHAIGAAEKGANKLLDQSNVTLKENAPDAEMKSASGEEKKKKGKNDTEDLSGHDPTLSSPANRYAANNNTEEDINQRLSGLVKAAPVMLFMKGTPSSPQCGFSRQLVGLLREKGVRYGFFNILADEEVRQGLKTFADWPTFPQLWVGGELVGGLDIVKEEIGNDPDFFKVSQS